MLRDTLIVQRVAQGWTWEAIAAEAGIARTTAIDAYRKRLDVAPLEIGVDPVKVVEDLAVGYQLSIGDFEAMAVRYGERHPAVAVGAKKGANEAREKLLTLLQATGRLPEELGALRHLIDLRHIATRMIDAMERFEERLGELPEESRAEIASAAAEVRRTFENLIGMDAALPPGDDEEPVDAEVVSR